MLSRARAPIGVSERDPAPHRSPSLSSFIRSAHNFPASHPPLRDDRGHQIAGVTRRPGWPPRLRRAIRRPPITAPRRARAPQTSIAAPSAVSVSTVDSSRDHELAPGPGRGHASGKVHLVGPSPFLHPFGPDDDDVDARVRLSTGRAPSPPRCAAPPARSLDGGDARSLQERFFSSTTTWTTPGPLQRRTRQPGPHRPRRARRLQCVFTAAAPPTVGSRSARGRRGPAGATSSAITSARVEHRAGPSGAATSPADPTGG